MTYQVIEEVDLESLGHELQSVVDLVNAGNRESKSRSVDLSTEEFLIWSSSPGRVRHHLVANVVGGAIAGVCQVSHADDGSNPDVLRCEMLVDERHRRTGIATELLRHTVGIADDLGRSTLQSWHFETVPAGAAFARATGATETMQFHDNVVRIEHLDIEQLTSWRDEGSRHAAGYEVEVIEGRWPEDLLENIANLYYMLERDMPLPDGHEPREWTSEFVGAMQDHYSRGSQSLSALAIEKGSGRAVGLTQLVRRNEDPTTWMVTTTIVDPAHRGRGLGKWIKAVSNLEALDRWPGGVYEETGNASTNAAMLAINRAMGFEHELTTTDVELDVAEAKRYLDSR